MNRYSLAVSDTLVEASVPTTNRLSPALLRVFGGQKANNSDAAERFAQRVDARRFQVELTAGLAVNHPAEVVLAPTR